MQQSQEVSISCLQHAIADAQATIKAYDVKAEVLGLLLTLAIGVTNFTFFQSADLAVKVMMATSCALGLVALLILGCVLVPKVKQFEGIIFDGYVPMETYFLTDVLKSPQNTVPALSKKVLATDWVTELTYELMKLSIIRDYKHKWFIRGVYCAAAAILVVLMFVGRNMYLWR